MAGGNGQSLRDAFENTIVSVRFCKIFRGLGFGVFNIFKLQ